jgi:hypothetical protein
MLANIFQMLNHGSTDHECEDRKKVFTLKGETGDIRIKVLTPSFRKI